MSPAHLYLAGQISQFLAKIYSHPTDEDSKGFGEAKDGNRSL